MVVEWNSSNFTSTIVNHYNHSKINQLKSGGIGKMNIIIQYLEKSDCIAPETLLGHNLEMTFGAEDGLLTERLSNPKFSGIADPQTGIATRWQMGPNNNSLGARYESTKGMFLSGCESQLIHNYSGREACGILQTDRIVLKGEVLQVSLWARVQHHPVTLCVGIKNRCCERFCI